MSKYNNAFKHEDGFAHFNFLKDGYADHAYSPYKDYPNRSKCSTCADQSTCERIETFNNDGCGYHTKVIIKKQVMAIEPVKVAQDIKYLTRVRYTGRTRVEI